MARPIVARALVRFDINEKEIRSFTSTANGMVTRWSLGVTREVKAEAARLTAAGTLKYGSGLLARSYSVVLVGTGEDHCEVHVKNTQPYAKYVFLGTRPIIGTGAALMPVGKSQFRIGKLRVPHSVNRGYGRGYRTAITPRHFVRGQRGKNFPEVALRLVLRRRRIYLG